MDYKKIKGQLALIREMAQSIEDVMAVSLVLNIGQHITPGDIQIFETAETWLNQITGNIGGYEREFRTYMKYRIDKNREVVRGTFADITITDPVTKVGKAIQLKSTIQNDAGIVTSMIGEAANQLSGERGEEPKSDHRRVIDMQIRSDTNPWPFTSKIDGRGTKTETDLRQKAIEVTLGALTKYRQHKTTGLNSNGIPNQMPSAGFGMSPKALGMLQDVQHLATASMANLKNFGPKSGVRSIRLGNQGFLLINLVVKIRFSTPYQALNNIQGGSVWIDEIKMQFDRSGQTLVNAAYAVKYAV